MLMIPAITESPKDDWIGLQFLFETLRHRYQDHHNTSVGAPGLSPQDLLKLVTVAEKYECLGAVRYHVCQLAAETCDDDRHRLDQVDF